MALTAAPSAAAGPLDDYRRNGQINPCKYTDQQLRNGLNGLPPDVQQYAPGLADQLSGGREGCGVGGGPGSSSNTRDTELVPGLPSAGGGKTPTATVPRPPSPKPAGRIRLADVNSPAVTGATGSDAPGWLLPLLLALGGAGVLVALARVRGTSVDRFARPLRASFADAGGRTADAFAELWDSVRFGR